MKSWHYLSGLLSLATISCVHAQEGKNLRDHLLIQQANQSLYGAPGERYEGSPFMNDDFVEAHVYSADKSFNPVLMRYDIFRNVMEFKDGNQSLLLDPDPRITRIEMSNQTFVVQELNLKGKNQNWFMELLEKGTLTLLAKSNVNYRKENDFAALPANYTRSADVYYCKLGNGAIFKVGSINKLIEFLPDNHDALRQFVKEQNLSSNSKDDLVKFARYYNSFSSSQ